MRQDEAGGGGMLAVPLPGIVVDSHEVTPWLAIRILQSTINLRPSCGQPTDRLLQADAECPTPRRAHLPVHGATGGHRVVEDARLQVRHDSLIAPCAVAKAHRCPARQTASLDAHARRHAWCGLVRITPNDRQTQNNLKRVVLQKAGQLFALQSLIAAVYGHTRLRSHESAMVLWQCAVANLPDTSVCGLDHQVEALQPLKP